ncbi:hypothetical protein BCR44DRAFT_1424365, partial [Catenaria anguillulae PL171]
MISIVSAHAPVVLTIQVVIALFLSAPLTGKAATARDMALKCVSNWVIQACISIYKLFICGLAYNFCFAVSNLLYIRGYVGLYAPFPRGAPGNHWNRLYVENIRYEALVHGSAIVLAIVIWGMHGLHLQVAAVASS